MTPVIKPEYVGMTDHDLLIIALTKIEKIEEDLKSGRYHFERLNGSDSKSASQLSNHEARINTLEKRPSEWKLIAMLAGIVTLLLGLQTLMTNWGAIFGGPKP